MVNYSRIELGSLEQLGRFVFNAGPLHKTGKIFLSEALGSNGAELSLNRLEPGEGYEFLHRHQEHEEIYIVLSGRGAFLIDGDQVAVSEGSCLRIAPPAARAMTAAPDCQLTYICIQAVAGTLRNRTIADGVHVPGEVNWIH